MSRTQISLLIFGWLSLSIGAGLAWLPAGPMVAGALALVAVYLSIHGDPEE